MIHKHQIQVRFGDTDAIGHVNNAAYASYFESARIAFLQTSNIEIWNLVLARIEIDYLKQLHFNPKAGGLNPHLLPVINTQIERIGKSSVTLTQTISLENDTIAAAKSVVVKFDYKTQKSSALSQGDRTFLEQYQKAQQP